MCVCGVCAVYVCVCVCGLCAVYVCVWVRNRSVLERVGLSSHYETMRGLQCR